MHEAMTQTVIKQGDNSIAQFLAQKLSPNSSARV